MIIRELQLLNFRNLKLVRADFAPGLNVICGPNAQGKTNLLEAVYMLVTGRSFRAGHERELIPWDREGYEATIVRAVVVKSAAPEKYVLTFNQSEKNILVNGMPIARLGDLVGRINAVLFTPGDLALVQAGPEGRRRFLDVLLAQTSREYLHHLQRYDLALRQRNALLKQRGRGSSARQEISVRDVQLAESGAVITRLRAGAIAQLSRLSGAAYASISGAREPMALTYEPSAGPASEDSDDNARRQSLADALAASLDDDLRRGFTTTGPHRDNFSFLLEGKDARQFGSQGQQRSCVLAVRFAETYYMEAATGEKPVLLLDDLMSELDEDRKRAVLGMLDSDSQTLLTCTEAELVTQYLQPAAVWKMDGGRLARSGESS